MKKSTKIIIGIAILMFLAPSVIGEIIFTDATCNRIDINFPISWHGYNCKENTGAIRGFLDPGAYQKMYDFYTPIPATETYIPETTYIYVTGGSTEGFN